MPKVIPGGGAIEMALAVRLERSSHQSNRAGSPWVSPYLAMAEALNVIPRTLLANCGANVLRSLTELRAKHSTALDNRDSQWAWGIDGITGRLILMSHNKVDSSGHVSF